MASSGSGSQPPAAGNSNPGSSTQGNKEPTPSSDFRVHFDVTTDYGGGYVGGKCKFCSWDPVKTTSNRVVLHLGKCDKEGVRICTGAPPAVATVMRAQSKKYKGVGGVGQGIPGVSGGEGSATQASLTAPVTATDKKKRSYKQMTLSMGVNSGDKESVDEQVARFCYATGVPFNVFQSPYWQACCSAIAAFGKKNRGEYKAPTMRSMRFERLQAEKKRVEQIMVGLRGLPDYGLTVCTDAYTSKTGIQYMNFVLVHVNGVEFLFSEDTTAVEKKTGTYIAGLLMKAINMVGPNRVVQICTDNASACLAAGRVIMQEWPHITHTPCTSHCLDLLLEDWGGMQECKDLCESAASVIRLIGRYGGLRRVFKKHSDELCGGKELIRPAATRFGTQFIMLDRMRELRVALRLTAVHPEWDLAVARSTDIRASTLCSKLTGSAFWERIDFVLELMAPVFDLLRLADGTGPCMGKIYWKMWFIREQMKDVFKGKSKGGLQGAPERDELQDWSEEDEKESESLDEEVVAARWLARWNGMHSPLQGAAYPLEPEHKEDEWHTNAEVMKDFETVVARLLGEDKVAAAKRELLDYRCTVLNEEKKKSAQELHGYQWWTLNGAPWPLLQRLAMLILSLCSSATSCERVWSTYTFIGTIRRSSLKPERLSDLVYCYTNLKLIEQNEKGFKQVVPQWWKPAEAAGAEAEDIEMFDDDDVSEHSDDGW